MRFRFWEKENPLKPPKEKVEDEITRLLAKFEAGIKHEILCGVVSRNLPGLHLHRNPSR